MLAKATAIAAHFNSGDIDEPIALPEHGDLEGWGPVTQMHFQRNGRGTVVEIVTSAAGVHLFKHVNGHVGPAVEVRNTAPHMVAELVIGISG